MKKVLFVATVVRLHINVFHLPYIQWFHEQGWQVDVAAKNDFENPDDCVIPYCDHYYDIPFERSPLKADNIRAYHMLRQIIEAGQYDLVYCHTPVGAMLGRLASIPSRKKNKTKVIYMAHGFHFYSGAPILNWMLYYPVEKFLSRFTDGLITINQEDYKRAQKFHAGKNVLIPGVGIDLEKFQKKEPTRQEIRKMLGISEEQIVLLSVGELSRRKNHMVVVEALEQLKKYNILYLICGDGPLSSQLRARAEELGVEDRLQLLGFRNDVPDIYKAADIFVFPSLQEGLPVALMEAMASGLPIIASRIRGNEDLISDDRSGYLVKAQDSVAIAEAVSEMIQKPSKRRKTAAYNYDLIKNYGLTAVSQKIEEFFNERVGEVC